MDFPVLEERAEERYQRQQRRMNPTVDAEGTVNPFELGRGEVWDDRGEEPFEFEFDEGRSLFRRVVEEGESEER